MNQKTRESIGRYLADYVEVLAMAKDMLPKEYHEANTLKEIATSAAIEMNRRGVPLGALPAPGEESEGPIRGETAPITAGAAKSAIFALIKRRAMSRRSYAEMKQLEEQYGPIADWPDAVAVKFAQTMEEEKN